MKNLLLFLVLLPIGSTSFSQKKKNYTIVKNIKNSNEFIVLKKDTLFAVYEKDFFIEFNTKKDYYYYRSIVFPSLSKGYLKQWKSEIKIYMNRDIDKYIRNNFKEFIQSFPDIKNLKISIVKKIEDANYYITTTTKLKSIYTEQELTEEELRKKLYYNFHYSIDREENALKSCVFKFNPDKIFNKKLFLRQIRKIFFTTLGQFRVRSFYGKEVSLLSRNDSITNYLTDFDKRVLNYHYQNIDNSKIYRKDFILNHKRYEK